MSNPKVSPRSHGTVERLPHPFSADRRLFHQRDASACQLAEPNVAQSPAQLNRLMLSGNILGPRSSWFS